MRAARKVKENLERPFGLLQGKLHVVSTPGRLWKKEVMTEIIFRCAMIKRMVLLEKKQLITSEGLGGHKVG